jgi:hypothetical protein
MADGPRKISDAWIFVSHSNSDIAAVRRVRDELEKHHANPLLFFLLCLDKDEELDCLIKREINARNFFLLCNSPAAGRSFWVQKERDFVLSLKDRKVHELDLDWPWEQQRRVIHETLRSSTTFVNYSLRDRHRVRPYIDLLIANDFAVFDDQIDIPDAERFISVMPQYVSVNEMIERSVNGYFFAFISESWLRSEWARREFELYSRLIASVPERRLVLAMLDPIAPEQLPAGDLHILDLSTGGVTENGDKLLAAAGLRSNPPVRDQTG